MKFGIGWYLEYSLLLKEFLRPLAIQKQSITTKGTNFRRCSKVTVIKKKFSNRKDNVIEVLEVKPVSSFVKKFNFENRYMFGKVLKPIIKPEKKTQKNKQAIKIFKKKLYKIPKIATHECNCELLNNNVGTPIKDSALPSEILSSETSALTYLDSKLLSFSLVDDVSNEACDAVLIQDRNLLRQHLNSLCENGSIPSVHTILEETVGDTASSVSQWSNKVAEDNVDSDSVGRASSLENSISLYLSGTPELELHIHPKNRGYWKSVKAVLPFLSNIRVLEEQTVHPFLNYTNIVDCIGVYNKNFVVVEWTTLSDDQKLDHTVSSLHVAANAGALNFDPRWKYMAVQGLIVVAFENGCPASLNYLSEKLILKYWKLWLKKLATYWQNVSRNRNETVLSNILIEK